MKCQSSAYEDPAISFSLTQVNIHICKLLLCILSNLTWTTVLDEEFSLFRSELTIANICRELPVFLPHRHLNYHDNIFIPLFAPLWQMKFDTNLPSFELEASSEALLLIPITLSFFWNLSSTFFESKVSNIGSQCFYTGSQLYCALLKTSSCLLSTSNTE